MILFAGFAALIPAGFIAWLALSKKTSPALKKFATIVLGVIALVFIVCTAMLVFIMIFAKEPGAAYGVFPASPPGNELKKDVSSVFIAAVAVLIILILVIVLAIREQRKK